MQYKYSLEIKHNTELRQYCDLMLQFFPDSSPTYLQKVGDFLGAYPINTNNIVPMPLFDIP